MESIPDHPPDISLKRCPNKECGILTFKDGGCNYLKCTKCSTEWCWECNKIKYIERNNKEHNSH